MSKNISVSILGVGLLATAAYLNVNGIDSPWLWFGVLLCVFSVID